MKPPRPDARPAIDLPEGEEKLDIIGVFEDPHAAGEGEPAAGTPAQPPPEPPRARRRARVLVADDDAAIRRMVREVLEASGCEVSEAANGLSALTVARARRPHLAILDAMMPGMHGFELCRTIRADPALAGTRIVLCSAAYRGTASADARSMFGADATLDKPFRVEELRRLVVGLLAGADASPERARAEAAWRASAEALAAGRPDEAVELARAAVAHDAGCAEAHYYLGHALERAGAPWEAMPSLERAAELRPELPLFHACLADLCERLGFFRSARAAWMRAAEASTDPAERRGCEQRLLRLLDAR